MINKYFTILNLILIIGVSHAQSSTDAVDIFYMQLFLDKENIKKYNEGDQITKNYQLFTKFKNNVNLKINKLEKHNKLKGNLEFDFEFYSLTNDGLIYNDIEAERNLYINYFCNDFTYILAINNRNGKSYRLAGFNGNDFLIFFQDLKEDYLQSNLKKLSHSHFFRSYRVDKLDFKCLYNSFVKGRDKYYHCRKRCSDRLSLHGG